MKKKAWAFFIDGLFIFVSYKLATLSYFLILKIVFEKLPADFQVDLFLNQKLTGLMIFLGVFFSYFFFSYFWGKGKTIGKKIAFS